MAPLICLDASKEMLQCCNKSHIATGLQEPTLPRQRRILKRIDDGSSNHVYSSAKDFFRCQYFDVLREELV